MLKLPTRLCQQRAAARTDHEGGLQGSAAYAAGACSTHAVPVWEGAPQPVLCMLWWWQCLLSGSSCRHGQQTSTRHRQNAGVGSAADMLPSRGCLLLFPAHSARFPPPSSSPLLLMFGGAGALLIWLPPALALPSLPRLHWLQWDRCNGR
jgi:hypothetical protein